MVRAGVSSVTISDIARATGTSTATVSRVMNGRPDVSAQTRARVLAALREHDYRPGFGRLAYDGVAVCLAETRVLRSFYEAEVFDGIAQAISARGCTLVLLPERELSRTVGGLDALCRDRRLVGVLFVGEVEESLLDCSLASGVPCVVVDRAFPPQNAVAVGTDIGGGIVQAVEHLVRLGHRHITLLNGPFDYGRDRLRAIGLQSAFSQANLLPGPDTILTFPRPSIQRPTGPEVWSAVNYLLSLSPRPTAIISGGEWLTIPALLALATQGIRLPRDMSFVAFQDAPTAQQAHPALTAIRQLIRELGQMAVDTLLRLASGDQVVAHEAAIIPMQLVIRESSGLAPDSR